MLGQGCLRALLLGNNFFPLKVGLWDEMGPKVGQMWVFGCKVGQNASKPTFAPTLIPFRAIHENPLLTQFKGARNCFPKRALRQSRPSIRHEEDGVSGGALRRVRDRLLHGSVTDRGERGWAKV